MANTLHKDVQSREGDPGLDLPPGPFLGLWQQASFSDLRIRLVSTASKKKKVEFGEATSEGKLYKEVFAHSVVLEAGSTYFKGLLTTGQDIAAQPGSSGSEPGSRPLKRRHEEGLQVIDISCNNEEEAEAMESVLEFLYTHKLPVSPSVSKLHKMTSFADYLGAELCIKACAISFSEVPATQQCAQLLCDVLDVSRSCPACNSAVITMLEEALEDTLLRSFSEVLEVINNNDLLLSFCKLPLYAVEAWGTSSELRVDSENSVVVLLNKWWRSTLDDIQTEDCKKRLSAIVRPAFLSRHYLEHVLDKLPWFVAPFPNFKDACAVFKFSGSRVDVNVKPFNKLVLARRWFSRAYELQLDWRVPVEEIQQVATRPDNRCIQGPSGYWRGHMWSLFLEVTEASSTSNDTAAGAAGNGSAHHDDDGILSPDPYQYSDLDSDDYEYYDKHDNGRAGYGFDNGPGKTIILRVGIRKGVENGMPSGVPAYADILSNRQPFLMKWCQRLFTDDEACYTSVLCNYYELATGLKRLSWNNHLMIGVNVGYVE